MTITNCPSADRKDIFSDVASIDIFAKVAEYFGVNFGSVFSVYHEDPNYLTGEVELFAQRDIFQFQMLEEESVLYLIKLESVSIKEVIT